MPHEKLSPPDFSSIEFMWIKDEKTGEIITAKKSRKQLMDAGRRSLKVHYF